MNDPLTDPLLILFRVILRTLSKFSFWTIYSVGAYWPRSGSAEGRLIQIVYTDSAGTATQYSITITRGSP